MAKKTLIEEIKAVLNEAATQDGSIVPANNPATADGTPATATAPATVDASGNPVVEANSQVDGEVVVNPPEEDDQSKAVTEAVKALCTQKVDAAVFGKLLEGEFSQEFKDSLVSIFESTVNARVKGIAAKVFSILESGFDEKLKAEKAKMNEAVVKYADAIAEEWLTENKIAIESSIKVDLNESFMEGLKNLLEDHYIEIPEDKVDVLEALNAKVAKLTEDLNGEIAKTVSLKEEITATKKKTMIAEAIKPLTVIGQDKIKTLAEATDFVNEEDFGKKLKVLVENFNVATPAPAAKPAAPKSDPTVDAGKPIVATSVDPMDRYVRHAVATHKEMR